jgi:hypothetical protein
MQKTGKKIELGLVQDYEKKISLFEKENNDVVLLIKKLETFRNEFNALDKKLSSDFKSLRQEGDVIYKKASDLGIETQSIFNLQNSISNLYGKNWDVDAIKFLRS